MSVMSLSGLLKTGQFVSADMFGANAVFSETNAGLPTAAYEDAAQVLGVQNIRFGGGQADLDPNKPNSEGNVPVDGVSAINIVTMPAGALRPEVVNFLEWCTAKAAAGETVKATLVIPTKHLSTSEYAAFAEEIEVFVQTVMQQYGDVIGAFQMGNEYWEMGETAYGAKASMGVEAIANGLAAAGIAEADQPNILVQMATAGNNGSEFPSTPGVSDFNARNEAANNTIIDQLSDQARDAIDGVTEHYYYNRATYDFQETAFAVKNINRDYAIWEDAFGDDLDLFITEWNVKTTATDQHGLVSASTLIRQFENMIEIGADGAHIWALDYHSRTALTLQTDNGVRLDDQGRLTNSASGAIFDMMAESIVGKERVEATFSESVPGIEVTSYASSDEMVFYISSRGLDQIDVTIDLASQLQDYGPIAGVKLAMDSASSNGLHWEQGEAADAIQIDGQPYFYNEHDIDVILTDLVFADASRIDLALNPFEVVELTVSLTPSVIQEPPTVIAKIDPPDDPLPPEDSTFIGTNRADQIILTDTVTSIDGRGGLDSVFIEAMHAASSITIDTSDTSSLTLAGFDNPVTLEDVERLEFSDGTLAMDIDGNGGQAYRLYKASFDRDPDMEGLRFWIEQIDQGLSLVEAAGFFIGSQEFQQTYGNNALLPDADFIDLLYGNVLDRTPDQAGYEFWRTQQENDVSRAEILVYFSESEENQKNVAPDIDDGIWYT